MPVAVPASPLPPPSSNLRHAFGWLIATMICVHACMATTRVTASLWVLNQGYGEASVGMLLSLFAVAPIVLSLWAGRLADRHGFHRPVGVGVSLAFVGALLALAIPKLWAIATGCLLCGGAVAVAAVAMQREAGLMAEEPGELKKIFSWMALGPAMSNALSPIIAGLLIDHIGMQAAFAFATLLPVLSWVLARKVPRNPPKVYTKSFREPAAWDLFRLPAYRRLLLVNLALSAGWDAHSFVVPVVGHARGLSAASIGIVLGSFAAAATTDANPFTAHAQGTSPGAAPAKRCNPSGKKCPIAHASGAIVTATTPHRSHMDQDCVSANQSSSRSKKISAMPTVTMAVRPATRVAPSLVPSRRFHRVDKWLPIPANTRKLAITTAAA